MQFQSQPPWLDRLYDEEYGPPTEKPLEGSIDGFSYLLESPEWRDILNWVEESISYWDHKIMDAKGFPEVCQYRGAKENCRFMKLLPQAFIEHLKIEEENEKPPEPEV